MAKVRLTLDDELVTWARGKAMAEGKSLSRFIQDLLAEQRGALSPVQKFLRVVPVRNLSGARFDRASLYDRL